MKVHFSPMRRDDSLVLERQGDILILNGEAFDFSPLPEGDILPAHAVGSDWFAGPVMRRDGVLGLTIARPHGPNDTLGTTHPRSVTLTQDGLVPLPGPTEPEVGS